MNTFCRFCSTSGDFTACACGYSHIVGCAERPACPSCRSSHIAVGKFIDALTCTKQALRSNSARQRLLVIFTESLAVLKSSLPRRGTRIFTFLREVDPWASDADFRGSLQTVLQEIPETFFNAEFANTLSVKIAEQKIEVSLEKLGVAVADVPVDQRAAVAQFLGTLVVASSSVSPRNEKVRGSSGPYRRSGRIVTARGRQLGF
jgi:hypothetical protein